MTIDIFTIIFLLGAIQGLILSLYLFFSPHDKRQAKYFLGFLILVLAYDMFETMWAIQRIRLISTAILSYSHLFTIGASVYLFVKTSLDDTPVPARKVLLFYLPAIVDLVLNLIVFTLGFVKSVPDSAYFFIYETHLLLSRLAVVVVFWAFFISAVREFRAFSANDAAVKNPKTQLVYIDLIARWLKSFLIVCFATAIVWSVTIAAVVIFDSQQVLQYYYPFEILLVFLIYWIGFTAYHRTTVVYLGGQKSGQIYFNKLSEDDIATTAELLSSAMTKDKVYLDPELTLAKLAAHLDLRPKTISAVLNQHLQTGFNEYVNEFRVEEAKSRLLKMDGANSTILAIALDSGFNSLPTFQRAFKNVTGLTPKQFLAQSRL